MHSALTPADIPGSCQARLGRHATPVLNYLNCVTRAKFRWESDPEAGEHHNSQHRSRGGGP